LVALAALALAVFVGLALGCQAPVAQGATLRMSATAPAFDNDGTCTTRVLYPARAGATRVVHFAWTGPVAGQDSVAVAVGVLATLNVTVPLGTYSVRAWASDSAGPGCDTTVTRTLTAPPAVVGLQ
jgi:hypothetical protein